VAYRQRELFAHGEIDQPSREVIRLGEPHDPHATSEPFEAHVSDEIRHEPTDRTLGPFQAHDGEHGVAWVA
jgi:hypothetical protein